MNTQPQTGVVQAAISDISVGRRFRQDLGDIGALAQSIQKFGLLQPIGVDEQYRLIFGQRRLAACRLLG
ncbi:ParB N-terminal domain-containing protein, partial [Acidithiobacillus caldus]